MFVDSLMIYPVKSLGCQLLQSAIVEARGLRDDRRLMLVDEQWRFITQREIPRLTLISALWRDQQLHLAYQGQTQVLTFGDVQNNEIPPQACRVRVWNDEVSAVDMGDMVAARLSQWLDRAVRLVYMGDDSLRQVDIQYSQAGDVVSFADGYPVLLISASSVEQFNNHLSMPLSPLNFRPNIVVTGASPYAEDKWRRIRIGRVEFDVVKPCSRCVVPSIDPITAQKNPEITRALATHRRGSDGKTYFGQNLIARTGGTISVGGGTINVGDAVEVIR